MDRRACPSYNAGLDACDPLELVQWSGRGESRAARVLRRRCRSEGVERSPFEDAHRDWCASDVACCRGQRAVRNHFTLSAEPREGRDWAAAHYGDYAMAPERQRLLCFQTQLKQQQKLKKPSNTPLLTEKRLPKVEELLEKVDQEMVEVKQPLKSILNNPPKSPPPGILKKSKTRFESKSSLEGRRRQRASSESDNFSNYSMAAPIPGSLDGRLTYLSANTKRAKDNSGTGYSYSTTHANISPTRKASSAVGYKNLKYCKEAMKGDHDSMNILRTSAINKDTVNEVVVVEKPRQHSPAPACPVMSPSLPVSSVTALPHGTHKKHKKKVRLSGPKCDDDDSQSISRSPSPSPDRIWEMETDSVILEMKKLEELKELKKLREQSASPPLSKPPKSPVPSDANQLKAPKLTNGHAAGATNGSVSPKRSPQIKDDSHPVLPDCMVHCVRPSLFPRVPPYLKFVGPDEPMLRIPLAISKHLKWKSTSITPIIVKKTLMQSGFKLLKPDVDTDYEEMSEWLGTWGKHMKAHMFHGMQDQQKLNHFPGTFQLGRKDRLWRNIQRLVAKFGQEEFGIMPDTYILPSDTKYLQKEWEKGEENNEMWIIKPPASARGSGIRVITKWAQIPKKRAVVVQKYVHKPYLINGSKFDLRLYVLVTSIHPLRIYVYRDGLARFASAKYNEEPDSLNDRFTHLTNYSINRLSKNYTPNEDHNACEGHKWTLQTLFTYLKTEKQVDTDTLWANIKDLVIKTILAGEYSISALSKAHLQSRYNCYELFGIDVLLDENLKPWLLEVNISPSLHSASPLDVHVKGALVRSVFNLAQFHAPRQAQDHTHNFNGLLFDPRLYTIYLSKEERDKHLIYTNMEDREMYLRDILTTLTPDDVRHLLQAEDELTQAKHLDRVFPTRRTHRYLKYMPGARYYNRLFDAWETRYSHNRDAGRQLLRNLCEMGYHLEVPPVPLKRAARFSAMDRCRMTSTRPARPRPPRRWARPRARPSAPRARPAAPRARPAAAPTASRSAPC
ncbi:tubulin monoglutamylase TTLL4 isoform X2 [Plutella xylostella]|uniref:tubulin monoglutamylase TTLL4 isoform X2 n=1 Tax=Plutella xylostella TaxID=51655 RepID=UPI0020329383|nr:tubulin monoglutamylase TTLL4 isoform X2 [Plutella xylostella]